MPQHTGVFTRTFLNSITILERMAAPGGTTIEELTTRISLTRRSVFRLIRNIERTFNIPVIVSREAFGGPATYRLPLSFVETLPPIMTRHQTLSIRQALACYMVLNSGFDNETASGEKSPE
jgi:hypothetical protein